MYILKTVIKLVTLIKKSPHLIDTKDFRGFMQLILGICYNSLELYTADTIYAQNLAQNILTPPTNR